ncbi:uncharacterized protein LOC104879041 [Vitis vinifera]|uniref:uncharacterized protein LOC104879041 n=1 Tax=Vitis vinifera TaxID=29760 RepID=UPI00053F9627|nr:uncharacterized protein LOC104879041 [Vitis vinifera]|eukprot:XP_010648794.1 PREDICTED: protein phosphatase 1K, mitochondrial [Vitis vinifera]
MLMYRDSILADERSSRAGDDLLRKLSKRKGERNGRGTGERGDLIQLRRLRKGSQPPPSSSPPPTSARRATLFPATMAADATLLVLTSTLPCPCFSRSPGTGPELSPLSSVVYPAGRVAACRAGSAIPLSTDHKPDRSDERQRIEDAGGFIIWAGTWRVGGVLAVSRA